MIDTTKVKMMTKAAMYENGIGRSDFRMNRWKESTYVSLKVLESLIFITIAYALGAMVYSLRYFSSIIDEGLKVFKQPAMYILVVYVALAFLCFLVASYYYRRKYRQAHRRLARYDKNLKKLEQYLEDNKKDDIL